MKRADPTDWLTPKGLEQIEEWALMGLTNEQLAKNMGIGLSTFYKWQSQYSQLVDALKKGKVVVDLEVENALFKRATGFKTTEEKYVHVEMSSNEIDEMLQVECAAWEEENPGWTKAQRDKFIESLPKTKKVLVESKDKFVPPDTVAAIFWLKNRVPQDWRDKRDLELSGQVDGKSSVDFKGIDTKDLSSYVDKLGSIIKEGEENDKA